MATSDQLQSAAAERLTHLAETPSRRGYERLTDSAFWFGAAIDLLEIHGIRKPELFGRFLELISEVDRMFAAGDVFAGDAERRPQQAIDPKPEQAEIRTESRRKTTRRGESATPTATPAATQDAENTEKMPENV